MLGALLVFVGLAGLIAYSDRTSRVSKDPWPKVGGVRPVGEPVRVAVRVPTGHAESVRRAFGKAGQRVLLEDIRARTRALGLDDVRAVTQDPTDGSIFRAVARTSGRTPAPNVGAELVHAERVEEPPIPASYPNQPRALDPGLTPDEVFTVRRALATEHNPRHLAGFASTFEPFFPIAASLLRGKAMLLEVRALRNSKKLWEANVRAGENIKSAVDEADGDKAGDTAVAWTRIGQSSPSPAEELDSLTKSAVKSGPWPEVTAMWRKLDPKRLPGWHRLDRMTRIVDSLAKRGSPTRPLLALQSDLVALARSTGMPLEILLDEVRRVACLLIEEPYHLLQSTPHRPTAHLVPQTLSRFPPVVVELGRRLVKEVGLGVWTIDESMLRAICPPDPQRDGYVSPSALQLALAAQKPDVSGVAKKAIVSNRFSGMSSSAFAPGAERSKAGVSRTEAFRARAQMERANRAIERRRWISWYEKLAKAS